MCRIGLTVFLITFIDLNVFNKNSCQAKHHKKVPYKISNNILTCHEEILVLLEKLLPYNTYQPFLINYYLNYFRS